MLTMIMMYGSMQALSLLDLENQPEQRYDSSVALPHESGVFCKTSTASVIILLQALVLILINHFVYGIDYRNIGMVMVMLIPLAVFVTSLGVPPIK